MSSESLSILLAGVSEGDAALFITKALQGGAMQSGWLRIFVRFIMSGLYA